MLLNVLLDIVAPILVMVALGAAMRVAFKIDITSLTKLNLYLFSPAFVFYNVAHSTLDLTQISGIILIVALHMVAMGTLVWGLCRSTGVSRPTTSACALAVMFYNSGNYGLPLITLAFPPGDGMKDGPATQVFVLFTMNMLTFTIGTALASFSSKDPINWRGSLIAVLKLPTLPMILAAFVAQYYLKADPSNALPPWINEPARYLANGLVPLALVTLGAQLASSWRWPRWRPVMLVVTMRLIAGPAVMWLMLAGFGYLEIPILDLWPWPAETLILAASVPTAINTLLLVLEMRGDAELSADVVFWTTILSPITITAWLTALRWAFA